MSCKLTAVRRLNSRFIVLNLFRRVLGGGEDEETAQAPGLFSESHTIQKKARGLRAVWRRNQIRLGHIPINASQVERKLSAQGWIVMNFQRDGLRFRCIAQRAVERQQSEVCTSRNEAIVQVAAKILRGGLVYPFCMWYRSTHRLSAYAQK